MRICWHSNSPLIASGYAVQTKLAVERLQGEHQFAISCNYGQVGFTGALATPRGAVPLFPMDARVDDHGEGIVPFHAENFSADVIMTHYDAWVFKPDEMRFPWVPWYPVDCEDLPESIASRVQHAAMRITQTHHGIERTARHGLDAEYVPAAFDGGAYHPVDGSVMRRELGATDRYLVVCVAANSGHPASPSRKSYPQIFDAFRLFLEHTPDAVLYVHAHQKGQTDLGALAQHYGITKNVVSALPYYLATGAYTSEHMAAIYSAADVLLSPSMGEGFGVPIVEAQACFPAGTQVIAEDARSGMRREYTGDLVRIEVGESVIEATPEHPFWTSEGWRRADDLQPGCLLAYVGDAAQGRNDLHRGRIAEVATALPHDDFAVDSRSHGQKLRVPVLSGTEARPAEAVFSDPDPQGSADLFAGFGVYRGHDRRRRHRVDQEDARLEMEAACADRQYAFAGDRMVPLHDRRPFDLYRDGEGQGDADAVLPVSDRGHRVGSIVRAPRAAADNQAGAHGTDLRMEPGSTGAIADGSADREAVGDHRADPGFEYQAIRSVDRRSVRDLQVFNLKTASGVYAAEGYLVHNCGTPVITGDWTAMSEVTRSGVAISKDEAMPYPIPGYGVQYLPRAERIAEALVESTSWSYDTAEVSERVQEYEIEHVVETHWRPVLAKLEDRLQKPVAPGLNRAARRRMKLADKAEAVA